MYVSKRNIDKEYIGALTHMHYVDWAQFSKLRSGLATVWPLAENLAITFIYEIVCYGSLNQILCVSMGKCDFNDHSQPGLKWMKLIFYTFSKTFVNNWPLLYHLHTTYQSLPFTKLFVISPLVWSLMSARENFKLKATHRHKSV